MKINLSPREVACLENGEMLNDTHINVANQMLRKQFPDVRGLQSPLNFATVTTLSATGKCCITSYDNLLIRYITFNNTDMTKGR